MKVFLFLAFLSLTCLSAQAQNDIQLITSDDLILDLKTEGKASTYYKKHYLSILLYLDKESYSFIDSIRPKLTFMNHYKLSVADYDFKILDTDSKDIKEVLKNNKRFRKTTQAFVNSNKACTYVQNYGKYGFSSELTCYQLERGMLLLKSSVSVIE